MMGLLAGMMGNANARHLTEEQLLAALIMQEQQGSAARRDENSKAANVNLSNVTKGHY